MPGEHIVAMGLKALDLTGRVAVVIGGTSGLGRAIALALAEAGADVVASSRRPELVEEVAAAITALERRTLVQTVDAGDRPSIDHLRDVTVDCLGCVDILVNAAGYTSKKPAQAFSETEWLDIPNANVTTAFRACQSFYPLLKESGRGRVINIASVSSFRGCYKVAPYGSDKAALVALTQTLAVEWGAEGINVNAIVPGVFPTTLNAGLLHGTPRGQEFLTRTPMRRFGKPEELGGVAVLLASDAASFITGETIAVDGGFLASGVNV
jgi:NAD(P)-dependent dehydrogenase (short-subunit alcohol dehydrogenase family)